MFRPRTSDPDGRQGPLFDDVIRLITGTPRTWSFSVAVALALVALSTLLRVAMLPLIGARLWFAFYHVSVTLAAVLGGFRAAAIALAAALAMGLMLVVAAGHAAGHVDRVEYAALIVFTVSAGLEGLIAASLRYVVLQLRDRDDKLNLVAAELRHRVKNMLAMIMSISRQIGRVSPEMAAFQAAFDARLKALARAHDILARSSWAGADLRGLICAHVDPFVSPQGPRLMMHGPDLVLAPDTAVSLSLVLHELTTNAVKYGALATPSGRLTLSWRCDTEKDDLCFDWLERGGPKVEPPERKGFGTVLIDRTLAPDDLIDFEPAGLHVIATFPLRGRSLTVSGSRSLQRSGYDGHARA